MRRTLSDLLIELAGGAVPGDRAVAADHVVTITALSLDLPIEVRLRRVGGEWELLADLPQWRWQTGAEELRSRLRLSWGMEGKTP